MLRNLPPANSNGNGRMKIPLLPQNKKPLNSLQLIPLSKEQKILLGRNRSNSQKKKLKLSKSKSYCETDFNNSINSPESLYAKNIQLKTEINKIKKELALVKSDNIKKDNEIAKKENLINSALELRTEDYNIEQMENIDECKHSNLISKIKKQYNSLKKELESKDNEIYLLKRNIKNSKMNELIIENQTLLSELAKFKALHEHLSQENENYMIKLKNFNQVQTNISKQHFIILSLQENFNKLSKENEQLKEENEILKQNLNKKKNFGKFRKNSENDQKDNEKIIEELKSQINHLLVEKSELEQQNTFLSNQIIAMNNLSTTNSSENSNMGSNNENNNRKLTEITYIIIKNFEANKITKEIAMEKIFKEVIEVLSDDSKIEKKNLIEMVTEKIMNTISSKNEKDKTKISFFISNLLSSSNNELGNFIDNFMKIMDNVKIYSEKTERDLMKKLQSDIEKNKKYFIDNYKNDFISFCCFRNLLNKAKIELDDTSAEFLIYKMKQFKFDKGNNISMFDLCYKNLVNILGTTTSMTKESSEPSIDERSDEIFMTNTQYDKTIAAMIEKIKSKGNEKDINSFIKIANSEGKEINKKISMLELTKIIDNNFGIELNNIEIYCLYNKFRVEEGEENDNDKSKSDLVDLEKMDKEIFGIDSTKTEKEKQNISEEEKKEEIIIIEEKKNSNNDLIESVEKNNKEQEKEEEKEMNNQNENKEIYEEKQNNNEEQKYNEDLNNENKNNENNIEEFDEKPEEIILESISPST